MDMFLPLSVHPALSRAVSAQKVLPVTRVPHYPSICKQSLSRLPSILQIAR
jgi:hypothetical protein